MRGIVFTEFLEYTESMFGYEVVDRVIERSDLSNNGAYTSVGAYPYEEMIQLLQHTCIITSRSSSELLEGFGRHLWGVFLKTYPIFFEQVNDSFTFLAGIDDKIHPQVLKLYPDAELPRFDVSVSDDNSRMELIYYSSRAMADFALGLIKSCMEHFGENGAITKENISDDGTKVRFIVERGA